MKIQQILTLANIIQAITTEGANWFVATQTHPGFWSDPDRNLQWYIDANWFIKTDSGLLYDPTK